MLVGDTSNFDIRCSNACTRSGLAALLLSAVAFALLQPLQKTEQLQEAAHYVAKRVIMTDMLALLETDPVWEFLKSSPLGSEASEKWTLAQLLGFKVEDEGGSLRIHRSTQAADYPRKQELKKTDPDQAKVRPAPPSAPTGLGARTYIIRRIEPLHDIASQLLALSDGKRLSIARRYSNKTNRSIYRWTMQRYEIIVYSVLKMRPYPTPSQGSKDPFYVPDVSSKEIEALTFPQIVKLIEYEPVKDSELDPLLREQQRIVLPPIGLPLSASHSATLVELALALIAMYFWLYYREARISDNFPAPATLFSIFARSKLTQLIFNLLLALPPISAGLLAQKSWWITPGNVIPAALVVLIGMMIALEGTPTIKSEAKECLP